MRLAVIIPCRNEEKTVATVVRQARQFLPHADVVVFDNQSEDQTAELARRAGAQVLVSPQLGKGNVVRHAVSALEHDVFILVDGDCTYDLSAASRLVAYCLDGADMAIASRWMDVAGGAFPRFHLLGNKALTTMANVLSRSSFKDLLSGMRVITRELLLEMNLQSQGFEIETELSLKASLLGAQIRHVDTPYFARPTGSYSKLRTFRDGWIILGKVLQLSFTRNWWKRLRGEPPYRTPAQWRQRKFQSQWQSREAA